jgi:serine phosphatase RsbU (regulator of sigma subunit)
MIAPQMTPLAAAVISKPHSHLDEIALLSNDLKQTLVGLERVTSLLVDARSSRGALERVGLVLSDVLRAERWSIMLKTELDVIRISLAKGLPTEVIRETQLKLGEGIAGRVARDASPVLYSNVEYELGMTSGGNYASPSAISVPIVLRGAVLGVINLSDKRTDDGLIGRFDESDLALALMAANQAALMIEMLRSLEKAQGRAAEPRSGGAVENSFDVLMQASAFDLLSHVTDLMTVSGDLDQVLVAALNGACELLNATRGSVMLCDEAGEELRIRANIGMHPEVAEQVRVKKGEGIAGRVLETGEALLLANATQARLGSEGRDHQSQRYRNRSALSVPLSVHGQVLGVININDRHDARDFSDNDLYIARVIANQAAVAISAARLLRESVEAAEMHRLMELAHDIQANLLPSAPVLTGLEVAGRSQPCASAGGDYIDYFEGTPAEVGARPPLYLACGDVSGHGVGAAVIMAMGRAFLRALLRQSRDLSAVMYEMNNLIEADTPTGQFMTLFVGILEPEQGLLRFVSAGHDPALLYRARSGEIVETRSTGLPLGMFEHQHYKVSELRLEPGDLLVLSTDGIAEATDIHGEFYGRERLKDDLRALHGLSADEIVDAIEARVLGFTRPKALTDDLSLIAVRILASA